MAAPLDYERPELFDELAASQTQLTQPGAHADLPPTWSAHSQHTTATVIDNPIPLLILLPILHTLCSLFTTPTVNEGSVRAPA
jgi:hypothetical protein